MANLKSKSLGIQIFIAKEDTTKIQYDKTLKY